MFLKEIFEKCKNAKTQVVEEIFRKIIFLKDIFHKLIFQDIFGKFEILKEIFLKILTLRRNFLKYFFRKENICGNTEKNYAISELFCCSMY